MFFIVTKFFCRDKSFCLKLIFVSGPNYVMSRKENLRRNMEKFVDECLKHSYYTHVRSMFLVDFTFK